MLVTPSFAQHLPIFVPWIQVRRITVAAGAFGSISLDVNFEHSTRFSLPLDAMETIRQKVAAEKFKDAVSYFEFATKTLKEKFNKKS